MYKSKLNKLILFLSITISSLVFGHGDETDARIEVESNLITTTKAGQINYQFDLVDTKLRTVLGPQDLAIVHERPVHVFIFDTSLNEFHHLHPDFQNNVWNSSLTLNRNGQYRVFVQGTIKADGEEFTAKSSFAVNEGIDAHPLPPVLGNVTEGRDGSSIVKISGKARPGKMAMLYLNFSRTDGTPPQIENYLGAKAHIVATPSDSDSILHVHPMDGENDIQMMIHVTFPAKGEYRLWVQFIDQGELKTVPLSLKID